MGLFIWALRWGPLIRPLRTLLKLKSPVLQNPYNGGIEVSNL